jgi:hypothetical protein
LLAGIGDPPNEEAFAAAVDADGNLLVAAGVGGDVTTSLGEGIVATLPDSLNREVTLLLVQVSPEGRLLWARTLADRAMVHICKCRRGASALLVIRGGRRVWLLDGNYSVTPRV